MTLQHPIDIRENSDPRTHRRRHPAQWVAVALIAWLLLGIIEAFTVNERLKWEIVGTYLFDPAIVRGVGLTIVLTVLSMLIGTVLGTVLAVMRLSGNKLLQGVSGAYIWFFRGTPLLVQMLFWAYASAAFPTVGVGVPFGPTFLEWDTNSLIPIFVAGLLALGLNESAYTAETIRAGILSVDTGQSEAALALGMKKTLLFRRIVLPQAMRFIIPPLGSATISMLKTTSLVFTIAIPELLTTTKIIYGNNFQQIPLLIVATIWYLALTTVLTFCQSRLEQRLGRGTVQQTSKRKTTRTPQAEEHL